MDGAGCSIVLDTIEPGVWSFKLPNDASIFTCEAFAILKTLEIATLKEQIDEKIQNVLHEYQPTKQIMLAWIPSHMGIRCNGLVYDRTKTLIHNGSMVELEMTKHKMHIMTKNKVSELRNREWGENMANKSQK
ncbi:hypothetical protein HHI36_016800 [Cryptolaemus montrouzieri]|uniref:RNase H type-1 domain-containing protein n=1 Tax=Cryptolaemus montrouzieri TaxID=559131 RepID=A0ABD2NKR4_9CUCU